MELHKAAAAGETERVRKLLDAGAPIDAQDASGLTALMQALMRKNPETATLLIERGVRAASSR